MFSKVGEVLVCDVEHFSLSDEDVFGAALDARLRAGRIGHLLAVLAGHVGRAAWAASIGGFRDDLEGRREARRYLPSRERSRRESTLSRAAPFSFRTVPVASTRLEM